MATDQEPTKPRILPRLNNPDRTGGEEVTLENIIGQAIGAASVCWENMTGAGVFDSSRARQILDEVMEAISETTNQQKDSDPAKLPQGTVIRAAVTGVGVIVAEKITGTEWQTTRGDWVSSKDLQRIRVLDAPDMKRPTPAAEAPAPERDRKADLVVEISDSVARDAEQLADMLHREGAGDDVAAAVASLAGYLADLAKDVKALAAIVAERGQS